MNYVLHQNPIQPLFQIRLLHLEARGHLELFCLLNF